MPQPLKTSRFYIDGAFYHYDNMPSDGVYVYDQDIDAYRAVLPKETSELSVHSPALKAWGYIDFSGVAVDDDILSIGGRTYELDVNGTPVGTSDVTIDLSAAGGTVDGHVGAIATAINADASAPVVAVSDTTNDILWLVAPTAGTAGNSIALDADSVTNGTVSAATLTGGAALSTPRTIAFRRTLVAQEATDGLLRIVTPLTTINNVLIQLEDAGVLKTPDTTVTVTEAAGASVILIKEGTTPAWAADDVFNILIVGA